MTYAFERLDIRTHGWPAKFESNAKTIFQTPAWSEFLLKTQHGELAVGELREGRTAIGYFTGIIVRKFGFRILGSPFPGWSTDYMGFTLSAQIDRPRAVKALIDFAFHELGCVHLEMMDRDLTVRDLDGAGVEYRLYRGFEIDLTHDEDRLFSNMTSACRRCVRKAEKEGVVIEESYDSAFADEYYEQLKDVFSKQRLVPTYDLRRVRELIRCLLPTGNLLLLRARDREGRCIATGIFPHMNGVIYFWGGASWRQYQSMRPNEAIQWHAMKIGKRKGLRLYDMGGSGEYKRKYGGQEIEVPWVKKSKCFWIHYLRDMAEKGHKLSQRVRGQVNWVTDHGNRVTNPK
jgi:hypothetical protein